MSKASVTLQRLWRRIKRQRLISGLSGGAFLIVFISQVMVFVALRQTPSPLVLHYTREGIDQFGTLWQLEGYGIIGLVIIVINYLIALELEDRDWFWGKMVATVTLVLSILLFIGFQAIISVN